MSAFESLGRLQIVNTAAVTLMTLGVAFSVVSLAKFANFRGVVEVTVYCRKFPKIAAPVHQRRGTVIHPPLIVPSYFSALNAAPATPPGPKRNLSGAALPNNTGHRQLPLPTVSVPFGDSSVQQVGRCLNVLTGRRDRTIGKWQKHRR